MDDTAKPFTAYDIEACLFDESRVELFREAIFKTVQPGDVVVDAGSGSGVLGMFAAQAGARRVYCIEYNRDYIEVIEANATRNKLSDKIIAAHADATTYQAPEPVNVIISEVISAGFFHEPQVQILENLSRYLAPGGVIVPRAIEHFVELIDAQETMYGLHFSFDGRYRALPGDRALSDRARYLSANSGERIDAYISNKVRVTATESGMANAIRIPYRIELTEGVWAEERTEFLLNPQVVFLPEPVEVRKGERYEIELNYQASASPRHCKLDVQPLSRVPATH